MSTNIPYSMAYVGFIREQEPKAPVTYCDHALSGVRRQSPVRRMSVVC